MQNLIARAKSWSLATFTLGILTSSAQAEELAFHNILTVSRSIVSPSQYYQVKEGLLVEADAGTLDGSLDFRSGHYAIERDIKGSNLGAAGFLAVNPSLVLGVKTGQTDIHVKSTGKVEERWITPSISYSPINSLTVAAQVNLMRGENKPDTPPTLHRDIHNFTFGMTAHEELWEATAVLSTVKKDEDNSFNSMPQTIGIHGRYRLADPITVGLNYEMADYTAISPKDYDFEDQTKIGLHVEAAMSESFSLELDYTGTENESGYSKRKGTETVILWQALLTPTLEAGARLVYTTMSVENTNEKTVSPGLFVAAHF